jgi:CDP-diacylglycerol---serine O-phosphatidyltransferase
MQIKNNIPNIITSLNLFSGCLAIIAVINWKLEVAGILVFIAAIFDFLDGMAARLLHAHSAIGKELDSLADVVSFGVAPGLIMFNLIQINSDPLPGNSSYLVFAPYLALLIPIFSALRLAKFNIDERQSDNFLGLPTPANAFVFASLPMIFIFQYEPMASNNAGFLDLLFQPLVLTALCILFSWLLVSEIPLFAMKFKSFSWKENDYKYIFLLVSLGLIIWLKFIAIPATILLYILFSVIFRNRFASTGLKDV